MPQRKIYVAIWHHKHGTNAATATSQRLAQKVMAEQVLDAMGIAFLTTKSTQNDAREAFARGDHLHVLELWKSQVAIDDTFEFLVTDLYEESPT